MAPTARRPPMTPAAIWPSRAAAGCGANATPTVSAATVAAVMTLNICDSFVCDGGKQLFDDLDDLTRARIDQHGAVVDVGVAIARGDVIFGRHLVIGHALLRQYRADAEFALVAIRRHALLDDIGAEARALFDAENAANGAGHRAE